MINPRYLGDGVYASFDGYHIRLHVGDHNNPPAVHLELEVLAALHKYEQDMADYVRVEHDKQSLAEDDINPAPDENHTSED